MGPLQNTNTDKNTYRQSQGNFLWESQQNTNTNENTDVNTNTNTCMNYMNGSPITRQYFLELLQNIERIWAHWEIVYQVAIGQILKAAIRWQPLNLAIFPDK